jgi:integrase
MVASRGGLRQSELLGLSWPNVKPKFVRVAQVADPVTRRSRQSLKSKRSERRVPLPPTTREALAAIRPPRAHGLCFPSPTDPTRPLARSSWLKVYFNRWKLAAAWAAAGAGEPEEVWGFLMDMQWKFLRHHAVSRWAAGGATITQVSRWSGDSIATLDKHYAYLFDEDEDAVMDAID